MMIIPVLLIVLCVLLYKSETSKFNSTTYKMKFVDGVVVIKYRIDKDYTFIKLNLLFQDGLVVLEYVINFYEKQIFNTKKEDHGVEVDISSKMDDRDVYFIIKKPSIQEQPQPSSSIKNLSNINSEKVVVNMSIRSNNLS